MLHTAKSREELLPMFAARPTASIAVEERLEALLSAPAQELWNRGGHRFRSQLVQAGANLITCDTLPHVAHLEANIAALAESIELLHLGSLIVDDIQDNSQYRRHGPALHRTLGVGSALSVGNWLYFRALRSLEALDVTPMVRDSMFKLFIEGIELAHYGQALDVGTCIKNVHPSEIHDLVATIGRYKSGALTMLAVGGGALLAGANEQTFEDSKKIGLEIGRLLQNLNDIGNVYGKFDQTRRYEDLAQQRVSFVWSLVLEQQGLEAFNQLMTLATGLPRSNKELQQWMETHSVYERGCLLVREDFAVLKKRFAQHPAIQLSALDEFEATLKKIEAAYG